MAEPRDASRPPAGDCPPELARRIDQEFEQIKQLALRGCWYQAKSAFCQLQLACLDHQPHTVDPFEVALADHVEIDGRVRTRLSEIGVFFVGQVSAMTCQELEQLGIGTTGRKQLRKLCESYGLEVSNRR